MDSKKKKSPKVLGVIPARGGSKRLERKNIKDLAGYPLIAYTIMAAKESKLLTNFLVSSEDLRIIEVAKKYDAPVPFKRPSRLATDEIRNIDVVNHALQFMEEEKSVIYDIIVLLQPTSPIRDPKHIDTAIDLLWRSDCDSLASVKGPFKKRDPILKAIRNEVLEDYTPIMENKSWEPFYLYNASIYAVKRDYFFENKKLISSKQVPLIMDKFHSIDIDEESDLIIAEAYMNYLRKDKKDDKDQTC
ncbi:MAG: acylneuraminate cytidylyltransferase family protein [Deltaproteobacteria bacterium]|nr:acylneuraminate cytidylyltransferase family protein [Deltaproteobacteria bacterium]